jgi:hypothetical protein
VLEVGNAGRLVIHVQRLHEPRVRGGHACRALVRVALERLDAPERVPAYREEQLVLVKGGRTQRGLGS